MSDTLTSLSSVSFLNLFGIVVTIVLCVLFIILGGHTLKYIKQFAFKIKIIVNKADDKNISLKDHGEDNKKGIRNSQGYQQMEEIFKNEIKKSRSLQFCNVLGYYLAKYDHILYFPFRDRANEKYNLLKPKTTFYTLLVICSCCISWMSTIFLTALLQGLYTNVYSIPLWVFICFTALIAAVSSVLNIICINRLFRIYVLNVKCAFRSDLGHQFVGVDDGIKVHDNEIKREEEEFLKLHEVGLDKDTDTLIEVQTARPGMNNMASHRSTIREDQSQNMNSTRKFLNEDFDRSDRKNGPGAPNNYRTSIIVEEVDEDERPQKGGKQLVRKTTIRKSGRAIKDVFDLQVDIDGVDDANVDDKYIFIEDKHAIGDLELFEHDAINGNNQANVTTFVALFIIIAGSSAVCCYLNYSFPALLSKYVFYMFAGSFVGDILVTRVILLFLLSLFRMCTAKVRGYRKLEYKSPKEIKSLLNNAIKSMFDQRKKYREDIKRSKTNSLDSRNSKIKEEHLKVSSFKKLKRDESVDNMMISGEGHYTSQNPYERNDTTLKNLNPDDDEEEKEDHQAYEIDSDNRDENMMETNNRFHLSNQKNYDTDLVYNRLEMDQKNAQFESTQNLQQFNTHIPFLSNLQQAIKTKEEQLYDEIMDKKQLTNDLVDYNLILFRKIYDAYEDRADKVIKNFRQDKHHVLRKRYMVPILNPNYDYEKLIMEMRERNKMEAKEEDEDKESVHLDGETVCEDYERQLMEAIIEEACDDLVEKNLGRQKIDKFGQTIDEDKMKEGVLKACPLPHYEQVQMDAEENLEEDDEEGRRRNEHDELKAKLERGEQLSQEELDRLYRLEEERLKEIERRIKELLDRGWDNLNTHERIEYYELHIERLNIELVRIRRRTVIEDVHRERIDEILEELKKVQYELLKLKEMIGQLSEAERERLKQMRKEFEERELQELQKKLQDGTITQEELERLKQLQQSNNVQLSEEQQKQQRDMEKKHGLLSEEELEKDEYDELLKKLQNGTITEEELKRLKELQAKHNYQLTEEDMKSLKQFEKQYGMQSEHDKELDELEELRRKLKEGNLTEEEMKRLQELLSKHNLKLTDEEKDLLDQHEELLRQKEQEDLNNYFSQQDVGEGDQGVHQSEDEDDGYDSRLIENQENFSELPPVMVMNDPKSRPMSREQQQELQNQLSSPQTKVQKTTEIAKTQMQQYSEEKIYQEDVPNEEFNELDQTQQNQQLQHQKSLAPEIEELERDPNHQVDINRECNTEEFNTLADPNYFDKQKTINETTNYKELHNDNVSQPDQDNILAESDQKQYISQQNFHSKNQENMEQARSQLQSELGQRNTMSKQEYEDIKQQLQSPDAKSKLSKKEIEQLQSQMDQYEEHQQMSPHSTFSQKLQNVNDQSQMTQQEFEEVRQQLKSPEGKLTQEQVEQIMNNPQLQSQLSQQEMEQLREQLQSQQSHINNPQQQLSQQDFEELREKLKSQQSQLTQQQVEQILNSPHKSQLSKQEIESLRNQLKSQQSHLTNEEMNQLINSPLPQSQLSQQEFEDLRSKLQSPETKLNQSEIQQILNSPHKSQLSKQEIENLRNQLKSQQSHLTNEQVDQLINSPVPQSQLSNQEFEELRNKLQSQQSKLTQQEIEQILNSPQKSQLSKQEIEALRNQIKSQQSHLTKNQIDEMINCPVNQSQQLSKKEFEELRQQLKSPQSRLSQQQLEQMLQSPHMSQLSKKELEELRSQLQSRQSQMHPQMTMQELDQQRSLLKSQASQLSRQQMGQTNESQVNHTQFSGIDEDHMYSGMQSPNDQKELQQLRNQMITPEQQASQKVQGIQQVPGSNSQTKQSRIMSATSKRTLKERLNSATSQEPSQRSRLHSRQQMNDQHQQMIPLEDDEYGRRSGPYGNEIPFGHDDLDFGQAPGGAMMEESIYSHKTSTILDEEKVSFMHIEHLPNQDNQSDDSFAEQDMVYYNKDDLTNYSKGLGLNKVQVRQQPRQQYYSENDLHEVTETDGASENEQSQVRSRRSHDPPGMRGMHSSSPADRQRIMGRGHIQHNDLEIEQYEDLIDGRVKVDSWNLNYKSKKRKNKKRKVSKNNQKKMGDLQNIYGVDARTLAGISQGRMPRQLLASGKLKGDVPNSDNEFRSTQNTFMQNQMSTAGKNKLKQSINDNQSNMFSFNGYGTSKRWNDIQSTLGGNANRLSNNGSLKYSKLRGKPTDTQQNFRFKGNNNNNKNDLEEELKSINSGSNASRFNGQRFIMPNQNNNKGRDLSKGSNKKKNKKQANSSAGFEGVDSHTESDEAVDDKGAWFQKRNNALDFHGKSGHKTAGGMNDEYDHSESEEGLNADNPNFSGNELMFHKRDRNGYDFDDLEAQQQRKKGKKGRRFNGEALVIDRTDSEEENDGGRNNFQRSGGLDTSNINNQQKPPLNNSKKKSKKRNKNNKQSETEESIQLNNIYGRNPYGGNGSIHPNFNKKKRQNGFTDTSDNERNIKRNNFNALSENEEFRTSGQKQMGQSSSNPNLINGVSSSKKKKSGRKGQNTSGHKRNLSQNDIHSEGDYIVGPESSHSQVRRPQQNNFNKASVSGGDFDVDDEERQQIMQRERKIAEDLRADSNTNIRGLAKKRKIKRAAQSQNPKYKQLQRMQELQDEKLRQMQREAEAAIYSNNDDDDDLEKGQIKRKKKKEKKEWVKKEINYWLDYDSPYAEYLVARFREWSPNPNVVRGASSSVGSRKGGPQSTRYNDIKNVYDVSRGNSNQNSRSPNRKSTNANNAALNNSRGLMHMENIENDSQAQMINVTNKKASGQKPKKTLKKKSQIQNVNMMFVDDFEEP